MWIRLDLSGTSIWFWLGLAAELHWVTVTLVLLATILLGSCCRGLARSLILLLALVEVVLVSVSLAALWFS